MVKDQVTYWDYLKLEELLNLQQGLDTSDNEVSEDELHFIVVHQVFELWFKLAIREIRLAIRKMGQEKIEEDQIPYVVHHLNRINSILKLASDHFFLMETLTPQDFLIFRDKLGTASGFQSFQMREMELLLGLELRDREGQGHSDPTTHILNSITDNDFGRVIKQKLEDAKASISLRTSIFNWLYRTPIQGSSPTDGNDGNVVNQFISEYLEAMKKQNERQILQFIADGIDETMIRAQFDKSMQQAESFVHASDIQSDERRHTQRIRAGILFIESYRELPLLSWPRTLLDTVVEMEEQFVTFRFRHARMVERIIGRRIGTGGSSGVDYLDQTTKYRMFPELSAIRAILLSSNLIPTLQNEDRYKFVSP